MTDEEPGSERWKWLAEGNAKQARKRVSVDVLIRDSSGLVLLVNPSYKDGWDLPGGMAEENEEPRDTAKRELVEELALDVEVGRLLNISWVAPHGPWDDLLAIIFDGGEVDDAGELAINDVNEISEVRLFSRDEAGSHLAGHTAERFRQAISSLESGVVSYSNVRERE